MPAARRLADADLGIERPLNAGRILFRRENS
jgi:hypothetical protein